MDKADASFHLEGVRIDKGLIRSPDLEKTPGCLGPALKQHHASESCPRLTWITGWRWRGFNQLLILLNVRPTN